MILPFFILLVTAQLPPDECIDSDLSNKCNKQCDYENISCKFDCETEPDVDKCFVTCNRQLWSCMADCPCMANCPNGCSGCDSLFCPCSDDGGEDYQICADEFEEFFWDCAQACDHDQVCFSKCNREYDENMLKCPCQSGCPNGNLISE